MVPYYALSVIMKIRECCRNCLKGLAKKTVALSGGDEQLLFHCFNMVDQLFCVEKIPPGISNRLLKYIRDKTNVYDPYGRLKQRELEEARLAFAHLKATFSDSLEDAVKLSAIGNSTDFFTPGEYRSERSNFNGDMDKITEEIYIRRKEVLILGDNVGDFIFDWPLAQFLARIGKTVYYALKEHPVQNDLSLPDVNRLGLQDMYQHIISTGSGEVGIRREQIRGLVEEIWEGNGVVIAKGMGNYETMSEYATERPVIHIMKAKCPAVAEALGVAVGTYIVMTGGEKNG